MIVMIAIMMIPLAAHDDHDCDDAYDYKLS